MILIEIYIKTHLKDELVDLFLNNEINDFFFFECNKYASKFLLVSEKEQVSGRMDNYLCRIYIKDEDAQNLIDLVKQNMKNTQIFTMNVNEAL